VHISSENKIKSPCVLIKVMETDEKKREKFSQRLILYVSQFLKRLVNIVICICLPEFKLKRTSLNFA
jgi:hypothetical protein